MSETKFVLPTSTILKVLTTIVIIWAFVNLRNLIVYLLFSLLFSVALYPLLKWFENRGMKRGISLAVVLMMLVLGLFLLIGAIVFSVADSVLSFAQNAPEYFESLKQYEVLEPVAERGQEIASQIDIKSLLQSGIQQGSSIISGASRAFEAVLFTFFFTVYMLLEREYLLRIIRTMMPGVWKGRFKDIEAEIVDVIGGYMRGQLITSFLVGLSSYIFFRILGIPNALALAIISGITDVIPVVGGLLGIIPAALVALTVSPLVAVMVVVLMQTYSVINNYFITPRVYGNSLELSPFIVTLATTAGLMLFGIPGILLALPVAAISGYILTKYYKIPIIEEDK